MNTREVRVFALALLASLLLHLALLASGLLSRTNTLQKLESKPLTVTMRSFALNTPTPSEQPVATPLPPQAAPEPKKDLPPRTESAPPPAAKPAPATPKAEPPADQKADEAVPEADTSAQNHAASEPLYLPDGSLNAANPQAWEIFAQAGQENPQKRYTQTLNDDNPAPPNTPPIQAKNAYDIIAPPDHARPSFPKDAQLRYEGPLSITGMMNFHRSGDNYRIDASFNIPFNKMQFVSEGKIQGNKLVPYRYTDTRKGKVYASAIFDYENKTVRYGKGATPTQTAPINGAQHDFFSWAWQMSIDGGYMPGYVQLTNGKKIYAQESPPAEDIELEETLYDTGEGKIRIVTQKIDRDRQGRHDTIGYGFAPDFANVPAFILFNNNGTEYQMQIIGIKLDGKNYWQAMRRVSQGNK